MLKRWKTVSSKVVHRNPWWTYTVDEFQIPEGISGEYNYVHTNGSSMIIPVTAEGTLVMVNQYRYLCSRESLEFPCGGVKTGMSHLEMAHVELEEETGFQSYDIQFAGYFNPFNGVTDEMCHVFIARNLIPVGQKPDVTEEFEILLLSPDDIDSHIQKNIIWDGMTLAAWSLIKTKL